MIVFISVVRSRTNQVDLLKLDQTKTKLAVLALVSFCYLWICETVKNKPSQEFELSTYQIKLYCLQIFCLFRPCFAQYILKNFPRFARKNTVQDKIQHASKIDGKIKCAPGELEKLPTDCSDQP